MKAFTFCALVCVLGVSGTSFYYPPAITYSIPLLETQLLNVLPYAAYAPCTNIITSEIKLKYQHALYNTFSKLFRIMVAQSDAHFAFSPATIYQTLAAIAEGSEGKARDELLRFLGLPEDYCTRQLYYQLASNVDSNSLEVSVKRSHAFIADSSIIINQNWHNVVTSQQLINVLQTSYKRNPLEVESWKQVFNANLKHIDLSGNSLILESLDYNGLWEDGFSDIVKEPFFDASGEEIATIEYMKLKKPVKVTYLPSWNMKVLDLPVGINGQYRMFIGLDLGKSAFRSTLDILNGTALFDTMRSLKKSDKPIEVKIPRHVMTSEVDVRKILEEAGIKSMWTDDEALRNISFPAAQPSSYIQRVTLTLDNKGLQPSIPHYSNLIPSPQVTPGDSESDPVESEFVANRPFLYGLFDAETFTCLFAASFSKPQA